jgi:hypothetical protein
VRSLADEGEVVVAAGSVRDRRAAVNRDIERCRVQDGAAGDVGVGTERVADPDCTADVPAAVDVTDRDGTAIGGSGGNPAIACRGDVYLTFVAAKEPVSQALRCHIRGSQDSRRGPDRCPVDAMVHDEVGKSVSR